jgi:hypothetical protein
MDEEGTDWYTKHIGNGTNEFRQKQNKLMALKL